MNKQKKVSRKSLPSRRHFWGAVRGLEGRFLTGAGSVLDLYGFPAASEPCKIKWNNGFAEDARYLHEDSDSAIDFVFSELPPSDCIALDNIKKDGVLEVKCVLPESFNMSQENFPLGIKIIFESKADEKHDKLNSENKGSRRW